MIKFNYNHLLAISLAVLAALVCTSSVTSAEKKIPETRFSHISNAGKIQFYYCYSCGYKKAFDDYSAILREKYPDFLIEGANYEPSGFNSYLSKVIVFAKLLMIFGIFTNFDVFRYLNQATPSFWRWMTENKLYACMMIFFLGNMLEAQLISSGAFEIFVNEVPVWSKMQSGKIPAPQELFQIIDSLDQFNDKLDHNPDFVK